MRNIKGKIYNPDRARQLLDFSGLRFGNMTPTDIDGPPMNGGLEYHNKAYIFIEVKYLDAHFPFGQRLFHERHTDDLERAGKPTLFILSSHDVHDYNKAVDVANTSVREYRFKGKWIPFDPKYTITVRKMFDLFLDDLGIGSEDFHRLCIKNSNQLNMNEKKIPTKTISLAEFVRERRGK